MDMVIANASRQIKAIQAGYDIKLDAFETSLSSLTEEASQAENPREALALAAKIAYVICDYRSNINRILSESRTLSSRLDDTSKALVKKYEVNLQSRSSRLTELREDLAVLQRLNYSNRVF